MTERAGCAECAAIPCVACGEPATVELTLTFTKGKPIRLALCAACEPDARKLIPPTSGVAA